MATHRPGWRRQTPHRVAIVDALRDQCWHSADELATRLAGVIPDDEAVATYQAYVDRMVRSNATRHRNPVRLLDNPTERALRGRRIVVWRVIAHLKIDGWVIEQRGRFDKAFVRLLSEQPLPPRQNNHSWLQRGSAVRRRICEVLADEAWHDIDVLAEALIGIIDPGEASRTYVGIVKHWRVGSGANRRPASLNKDGPEMARLGLRHRAVETLNVLRHDGAVIDSTGRGAMRRVRLVRPPIVQRRLLAPAEAR